MQLVKDLLTAVLKKLESPVVVNRSRLVDEWPGIAGSKIAPHTKPTLSETGELCVWVDQSSLAFELNQRYRQSLLKRAQAVLGEQTVKTIRFRVGQLR